MLPVTRRQQVLKYVENMEERLQSECRQYSYSYGVHYRKGAEVVAMAALPPGWAECIRVVGSPRSVVEMAVKNGFINLADVQLPDPPQLGTFFTRIRSILQVTDSEEGVAEIVAEIENMAVSVAKYREAINDEQ
jgi:hypothetical protein